MEYSHKSSHKCYWYWKINYMLYNLTFCIFTSSTWSISCLLLSALSLQAAVQGTILLHFCDLVIWNITLSWVQHGFPVAQRNANVHVFFYRIWLLQTVYFKLNFKWDKVFLMNYYYLKIKFGYFNWWNHSSDMNTSRTIWVNTWLNLYLCVHLYVCTCETGCQQSIMIKTECSPCCKADWCYCRQRCKWQIVTGNH